MIVCIAEKPSVASEIAKVLGATKRKDGYFEGNGYQVTWTFGHLCCLKNPEEYHDEWKKWSFSSLPMLPEKFQIKVIENAGVKKQFKIVKALFKKASTIINCGDAGQEGELIQRWVLNLSGAKCPVKRLWISSLTEESIRQGFRELRPQSQYDTLYKAGEARAVGDWLLGMNATRAYTLKYGEYRQVLSIGRVQTPTLAMIVGRDKEIDSFVPKPYWMLTTKYKGVEFQSTQGKLPTNEIGTKLLDYIKNKDFAVSDIQKKECREQPPQLYDLTSLQVDCNKKYGYSADITLKTIQSLYEKKVTTYPRVDTKYLTNDIYPKCIHILSQISSYGVGTAYEKYCRTLLPGTLKKSSRVFDDSKVTDHHAIIPTGETIENLTSTEGNVYDLICRRFIAAFYADHRYAATTVIGNVGNVGFKATGKTVVEEGWHSVIGSSETSEKENSISAEKELPQFCTGESGSHTPTLVKKMTTPPKRYTDATLLQAMETAGRLVEDENLKALMKENGIGRPSSRAGIIETLIKRGYVERTKKNLISTEIGKKLVRTIKSDMLKSPETTGVWEKKLRDIEKGKNTEDTFILELQDQINEIIREVKMDNSVAANRK